MGIDTRAVIVVGYTYDEIYSLYEQYENLPENPVDFYDWKEYVDLRTFFPYYDAPDQDCLFGIDIDSSGDYSYSLLNIDNAKVQEVTKDLIDKFGITPAVYLSPDVG